MFYKKLHVTFTLIEIIHWKHKLRTAINFNIQEEKIYYFYLERKIIL